MSEDGNEFTIDFNSVIVHAENREEAMQIALEMIKDGEVTVDQILEEGVDYESEET